VNKTLVEVCRYSWIFQSLLIGVSLLPLKYWRSNLTGGLSPAPSARQHRERRPSAEVSAAAH
jgi:hypothetical protein